MKKVFKLKNGDYLFVSKDLKKMNNDVYFVKESNCKIYDPSELNKIFHENLDSFNDELIKEFDFIDIGYDDNILSVCGNGKYKSFRSERCVDPRYYYDNSIDIYFNAKEFKNETNSNPDPDYIRNHLMIRQFGSTFLRLVVRAGEENYSPPYMIIDSFCECDGKMYIVNDYNKIKYCNEETIKINGFSVYIDFNAYLGEPMIQKITFKTLGDLREFIKDIDFIRDKTGLNKQLSNDMLVEYKSLNSDVTEKEFEWIGYMNFKRIMTNEKKSFNDIGIKFSM